MLIVMKTNATENQIENVINFVKSKGFETHLSRGELHTVIGCVGGHIVDRRDFELLAGVSEVIKISTGYKLTSRTFQEEDTIIEVNGVKFGGAYSGIISGPCTIESEDQIFTSAKIMSELGVKLLRGGAYKPRTSPYAFQGLGIEGLKLIRAAANKYGMGVVSEVMEINQIEEFIEYADILQVGARNMQNFNLLKELGTINKPIILKRGLSATIEEWIMAAEYIMSGGNRQIILCERGIRTFEKATRNTLDLSAIPVIKNMSHLPVIVDPSHATGLRDKVSPMSKAAIAAGADGLIIECHPTPDCALCDGAQSLYPEQLKELLLSLNKIGDAVEKRIQ